MRRSDERPVRALIVGVSLMLIAARGEPASAQQGNGSPPVPIDDTIEAGEADAVEPARRLVRWNEYEGPFFTIRFGGGLLYEYAGYSQDENSKAQVDLTPEAKVRDTRVLFKGRLKFKRSVTWSAGLMYDGPTDEWLVRELLAQQDHRRLRRVDAGAIDDFFQTRLQLQM
jgi:hypothetical protein